MTPPEISIRDSGNHACCFRSVRKGIRLLWELTRRCNTSCIHCFVPPESSTDQELTTEQCVVLLKSLFEAGVIKVMFTGGEPLLRHDLPILLGEAFSSGLHVDLMTNATLLTEQLVCELKEAGLSEATVSLDGSCREIHDRHRGPGHFERAVRGIRLLVSNGVSTDISCVPTQLNVDDIGGLPELCRSLGCSSLSLAGWFEKKDMRSAAVNLRPSRNALSPALEVVRQGGKKAEIPVRTTRLVPHAPLEGCEAGKTVLALDALGFWHPCIQLPVVHKDSTDARLVTAAEVLARFCDEPQPLACASDCNVGENCIGGCPADQVHGVDRLCIYKGRPSNE